MDSEKDPQLRAKIMESVDSAYSKAIAGLYGELQEQQVEEEIDENDPFWQAMERGLAKRKLPNSE